MKKLNNDHNYKVYSAVLELDRTCALLGGESILEKIINSMTFKLKVDTDYFTPGYPITIKGEGTLKPISGDTGTIYGMNDKTLLAQGTITLTYEYTGEDEGLTIKPEEFTVKAQVRNMSPCESDKIDILIESLGSDDETYVYEQTYGEYISSYPWVKEESEYFFEKELKEVPYEISGGSATELEMIDFSADLNNGQAKAADQTFRREEPSLDKRITVHLILEHTPNE